MAMQLRTIRIIIFFIVNIALLYFLYKIPIVNNPILERLCVYKNLLGRECWNCGMTRAYLSILHGEYKMAIEYNWKSIILFPITVLTYLHSWYKYIVENN